MMMMIPPPSHDHEYTELGIHKTIASNISTTMRRRGSNPPPQSASSTVNNNTTTSCGSKNFDSSSYSGPLQCRPREFDDSKELPEPGQVSAGVKPSSPASPPPPPNLPSTHRPRSFNDATNPNAALHRALLAIKKQQQRMATNASNAAAAATPPDDGRSITNPDARTLSMRERGRWGNSKMQQHIMFSSSCAATHGNPHYDGIRVSADGARIADDGIRVNSSPSVETSCGQYSRQPLQHVRCLHCGSFSTTPVMGSHHHSSGSAAKNVGGGGGSIRGGGGGGGSHSFGRRSAVVRDYSWQQELYEKKIKADQPTPPPPAPAPAPAHRFEAESGDDGQFNARLHHHSSAAEEAQFCRYPDNGFAMGGSDPSSVSGHHLRFGHHHHHHYHQQQHNPWTWQGRYMLLCQAIAAGAFMDEELSHMATAAGYSCAACEWGGGYRRPVGGGGATPGASESGFGTTATSERMMELEAFSGPLGYVSESKGNAMHSSSSSSYYAGTAAAAAAEQATMRRRRGGGGKWWSRISGLARNKSAEHHHHHHQTAEACATTPRRAAAQSSSTAQCAGCGQRLWVHDELSRAATKRLCPDCLISSPASPMGYRAADQRENEYRRRPPPMRFAYKAAAAAAAAAAASASASGSSRPCPKRWRLMRLCRYLLGL